MNTATHIQVTEFSTPEHWQEYYAQKWDTLNHPPESIPFFGTNIWNQLTADQRQDLADGYVQINAEVIIHLEQGLLLATRQMRRQGMKLDEGMQTFVSDEILHIDACREFLKNESGGAWPRNALMLHQRSWSRRICAMIYRWEPLGVFLPGAKSEVYAVQYHVALKKHLKTPSKWGALVRHHAVDEAGHISKDFELLRDELSNMSMLRRFKVYLSTLLCVLMTQLCLALPAWRLMARVFPRATFTKRCYLTLRFAHWVLNIHPAFPATRKLFSQMLKRESDPFFRRFAFMGW